MLGPRAAARTRLQWTCLYPVDTVCDDQTPDHFEQWQEEWYTDASKFLKAVAADDKRKNARKYRFSSWEWSVCLDNIFKVQTSRGLERFVDPDYLSGKLQNFAWRQDSKANVVWGSASCVNSLKAVATNELLSFLQVGSLVFTLVGKLSLHME